ncbi:hypothetical protein MIB92_02385 [Aestuariirhabdus sp. Z084]|uniref:hypothetical protein n=1 Tax=Aestuariirhabdus haliotis TaxID=2918751 RepID=UPI00201B3D23|nr:hypothetical protein [Aestuariirhabdus haliotis]MCL6414488.1 hypothetical protein [Aestuariirhabdus haliotis]MCL6418530.1 hypothetical protein [Aestuariirhabdus haliotis]
MDEVFDPVIVNPTRRIDPVEKGRPADRHPLKKEKQQQHDEEPEEGTSERNRDPLGRLHIDEYV